MKAFFPGSFDPFTKGHLDIVARGLKLFADGIIIGIGYNEHKPGRAEAAGRAAAELERLFEGVPRVEIKIYDGLTVDAAAASGAGVILRGFRNAIDAEYERSLADANHMISGLETVMLAARPELAPLSSSMVRELLHNDYDVSRFLPTPQDCIRACEGEKA